MTHQRRLIDVKTFVTTAQSELPRLKFEQRLSRILVQHAEQRVHKHSITDIDPLRPY